MGKRTDKTIDAEIVRWEQELEVIKKQMETATDVKLEQFNVALYSIYSRIAKLHREKGKTWHDGVYARIDWRRTDRFSSLFPPNGSWVRVLTANGSHGGEVGILKVTPNHFWAEVEFPGKRTLRKCNVRANDVMEVEPPAEEVQAEYLTQKISKV